jgi:hypothetical protein
MYNNINQRKIKDMIQLFKNKASLFVITLLLCSTTLLAQDDPGFGDDGGGDPGAAPISDWIPLMFVLAIVLVFYYTRKRRQVQY